TGVNLLNSGSMTYGDIYITSMLKIKREPHTQNHQCAGLHWTSQSTEISTTESITVDINRDFKKSDNQRCNVMVLKPCLFSILKIEYRLNGAEAISPAYDKSRKNSHPE